MQCIAHILLNSTFIVRKTLILIMFLDIYMQRNQRTISLAMERATLTNMRIWSMRQIIMVTMIQ